MNRSTNRFTSRHRNALLATLALIALPFAACGHSSDKDENATQPTSESAATSALATDEEKLLARLEGEWSLKKPFRKSAMRFKGQTLVRRVFQEFDSQESHDEIPNGAVFVVEKITPIDAYSFTADFDSSSCGDMKEAKRIRKSEGELRKVAFGTCEGTTCETRANSPWLSIQSETMMWVASPLDSGERDAVRVKDYVPSCYICDKRATDGGKCLHYQMVSNPEFKAHLE